MGKKKETRGLALFCSSEGIIEKVIKDDFGIGEKFRSGKLFYNAVDEASRVKSLDFINETKSKNITFDYQLNCKKNNKLFTLTFIGIALDQQLLLIASDNHTDALKFMEELQQITNEQANTIRQILKEKHIMKSQPVENLDLYDELSKANNELVNLQRELRKKNIELERLNDLKNRFLGMAAHDLRNPLNAIQSFTTFIIEEAGENLNKEHHKFLDIILSSSEFMISLIEDLLDISKIESGTIEINREKTEIVRLIKNNVEINNSLAERKNIRIQFNTDIDQFFINIDKNKMEQVLNNLINNAVKFSYENSEIQVNLRTDKDSVHLSIKDYGIGIRKEDMDKLFIPFKKIAEKGTKGEKCTGLGLSIIKKIIESHDGKLRVESQINEGSTFHVLLPANA